MTNDIIAQRSTGSRLLLFLMLPALLLGGCATDQSDVGFGDVLAGVTGAIGAATTIVGIRGGNAQVAQQGVNAMQKAAEFASRNDTAVASQPGAVAQGSQTDLNAVAQRCSARAEQKYFKQAQNETLQKAACIYHCAWIATGDTKYRSLYIESERNANSLCSIQISRKCNDIEPTWCRI
jgi:hypothetical protein